MPKSTNILPVSSALFNIAASAEPAPEFYGDVPLPSPRALPVQAVAPPGADCPASTGLSREGATSEICPAKLADIPTLGDIARANFDFLGSPASVVGEPPLCITGVQSAERKKREKKKRITLPAAPPSTFEPVQYADLADLPVSLKPDYFNFTYAIDAEQCPELEQVQRLTALLGDAWQSMDGAMYRYQKRVRCGNIWVLWDGLTEDMGVHVQVSGQGVSELEARGVADWREWLAARLSEGARFSQTHFAFDVKDGSLTIDMIDKAARAGLVSSHFNVLEPVIKFDGQGVVTDRGFNFGNRGADTSICFYDKALEQRKKRMAATGDTLDMAAIAEKQKRLEASWAAVAGDPAQDVPAEPVEPWTRAELRNRNARAHQLVLSIVADGWGVVAGVLAAAMDVKERGEGIQRCRWSSAPWWAAFIAWAGKARLKLDPAVRTLQGCMAALERQYGALIAACHEVIPQFWHWLREVRQRGEVRLSDRHKSMMAAYAGHLATHAHGGTTGACVAGGAEGRT